MPRSCASITPSFTPRLRPKSSAFTISTLAGTDSDLPIRPAPGGDRRQAGDELRELVANGRGSTVGENERAPLVLRAGLLERRLEGAAETPAGTGDRHRDADLVRRGA